MAERLGPPPRQIGEGPGQHPTRSALLEAHESITRTLRELVDEIDEDAVGLLQRSSFAANLERIRREIRRLEGLGRDWEEAVDSLLEIIREGAD